MPLLKIENIEVLEGWNAHGIFWTVAIVASALLVILLVYSLFSEETEVERERAKGGFFQVDARQVLLFFTTFGWAGTILSYFSFSLNQILWYSLLTSFILGFIPLVWKRYMRSKTAKSVVSETGRVLESIPPHRAGMGKVYLNQSRTPLQLDAVTIGRELPVGVPVRIVEMIDDNTAVVEPLDSGFNRIGNADGAPV